MTSAIDVALRVPAADEGAIFSWLQGIDHPPFAPSIPAPGELAQLFDLVAIESTSSFWDEGGPGALSTAVSEMLSGLALAGASLFFTVQRSGSHLDIVIGVEKGTAGSAATIVGSTLRGSRLVSLGGEAHLRRRASLLNRASEEPHRLALVGTPRTLRTPRSTPLLERLSAADVQRWSLTIVASPADPRFLLGRYAAIADCRRQLMEYLATSRRVSGTATRETRDPAAELLVDQLGREERRTLDGLRMGAFVTESWLGAEDLSTLRALGGVAAAALAPDGQQPCPLRLVPMTFGGDPPGTLLLCPELASITTPPAHDVPGFPVAAWARFDEVPEPIGIGGSVVDLGETKAGVGLRYPIRALTGHTLVTGTTGSGKSTFVVDLLHQLYALGVPFLVLEPIKSDYTALDLDGLTVWRIGAPDSGADWRLNPLEFATRTSVQTHIDLLLALFRSTFGLLPPLPYILEMGLRTVFAERGWDLATSTNARWARDPEYPAYPTLGDLRDTCVELVDRLGYSGEVRDNVQAALGARLGSLLSGAKGRVLDVDTRFPVDEMLTRPCVVNLEAVGNDDEKSFFLGLILIRLLEARQGQRAGDLVHVTVLEEAHRVLREPVAGAAELPTGDFAGETFANLLAEVRGAGEGVIVVDQSVRKLASDAVANTNLKVAFRTSFGPDKNVLAGALNLDEQQQASLTGFRRHEAAVFWEGMDRPVRAVMRREYRRREPSALPALRAAQQPLPADPRSTAMAEMLVATAADEQATIRGLLRRRIQSVAMGDQSQEELDQACQAMVERAVHAIGRRRGWNHRDRQAAVDFSMGGEGIDPRLLLLDGRHPLPTCSGVCPDGGCLVAEQGRRIGIRLQDDLGRLLMAGSDGVRATVRGAVRAQFGDLVPSSVEPTLIGCSVLHAVSNRLDDISAIDLARRAMEDA